MTVVRTIPETLTNAPNASGKNALLNANITTRFASAKAKNNVAAGCAHFISFIVPYMIAAADAPKITIAAICKLKYVVIDVSMASSEITESPRRITVVIGWSFVSRFVRFICSPFCFLNLRI